MSIATRLRDLNERLWPGHMFAGPEWLILCVNNHCNLHCRMCDVGTGNGETNFGGNLTGAGARTMSISLYRSIVDDLARTWPRTRIGFAYTEPLAWPALGEALGYAQQMGIGTTVTTNGLLLERQAAMLARSGVQSVSVSIDGPEEVHDHIRRKQGSFARATSGIRLLREQPEAPPVTVVCTISSWNCGDLVEFVTEMAELDIEQLIITHNSFITQEMADRHNARHHALIPATASNVFESDVSQIDTALLSAQLRQIAEMDNAFPITIQPRLIDRSELDRYYSKPESWIGTHCRDAYRMMMIDADGTTLPAHGRCYRTPAGRFGEKNLKQLWNAEAFSNLRRTLDSEGGFLPACSRCCSAYS